MRINLLTKILVLLIITTIIPLSIVGYLAIKDAKQLGYSAASDAKAMGDANVLESTLALNQLGEQIIMQKAKDVAKQIEIYLKENPEMTVSELQNDNYFKAIAVQPVGKTGYTAVTEINSLFCRFHSNPKIANTDLHELAEKLPGFWGVMSKSQGGKETYGYYDWKEADGSIKQKYMYISIVNATTKDGIIFSVAATTYIDEFNQPIIKTKENINNAIYKTNGKIRATTEAINRQNTLLISIIVLIVFISGFIFAKSLIKPLKDLTNAAKKLSEGETKLEIPEVKTDDEIKDLSESFKSAIAAIQLLNEETEKQREKKKK
jgi:methyl-accepting chemotaxis protein